tara:strand:- start:308 stop:1630 length:1323 start_codon:yes stop_codon:yes gene_type:complete
MVDVPHTRRFNTVVTAQQILDEDWFGLVCVSVQPCKSLTPLIEYYDPVKKKLILGCEKIEEVWIPTCILKPALKYGDKLLKVFSYHKYRRVKGFNDDLVMKLFVKKECASRDEPEDLEEYARRYDETFGTDFGDMLRDSSGSWGYDSSKRSLYKILMNCGWGKHCQDPHLKNSLVLNDLEDQVAISSFVNNVEKENFRVKSINNVGTDIRVFEYEDDKENLKPNLHNSYIPGAIFVTAYGRLQLWSEMRRIEASNYPGASRRVRYCDTDSMIYRKSGGGLYNTPETEGLGGWLNEHKPEMGGIAELVTLGPKTYSYKHGNGTCSPCKTKGVRLNYSTESIVNFNAFKTMVFDQLEKLKEDREEGMVDGFRRTNNLLVPQVIFGLNKDRDMVTKRMLKRLGVNINDMKGDVQEDGTLLPFGYHEAPEREVMVGDWNLSYGL